MMTKKSTIEGARRKYAPEHKARLALEIISGKRTVADIARTEHMAPRRATFKDSVLYNWRNEVLEKLPLLFEMKSSDEKQQEREAELEQIIGQLTVENQTLKKTSRTP